MLTNKGLVEHAKAALKDGWGYVWGSFGQTLTEALLLQLKRQYPEGVGGYETFIRRNWLGKKVSDCGGLVKSYYWTKDGKFKYDGATDITADRMLSVAKEKGPIGTMPEIPGALVHRLGHVGIYIGNGLVIEAKGTKYGVVQTELKKGNWANWSKCPFIEYLKEKSSKEAAKPEADPYRGVVTASTLNVRSGAGTSNSIIGTLKKGEKVRINKEVNGWYNIYYGDNGGWVSASYINLE